MDKRIIAAIIGVMALIVVGLGVLIFVQVRGPSVPIYDSDTFTDDGGGGGPSIDSGARIEIEKLRQQIEVLEEELKRMQGEILRIESTRAPSTAPAPDGGLTPFVPDGDNQIVDSYAKVVLIAARRELNKGVEIATPRYLESIFGKPRANLTSNCEPMTNERLASKLRVAEVGPIRVQMLQPAIDSLAGVFEKIRLTDPDLYDRINTSGSLCVRHIRGAPNSTSTHAFGLSLDLNIDGRLDTLGDGRTQLGLTILADFFRDAGWYWGAGFSREDSMHFEASKSLVEQWIAEGKL